MYIDYKKYTKKQNLYFNLSMVGHYITFIIFSTNSVIFWISITARVFQTLFMSSSIILGI